MTAGVTAGKTANSQVAELVDATLSRLGMPDSQESVEMCKGNIGDS